MIGMVLGAVAIGITLGLLGSGGSILTVPVLVYGLGHSQKSAIAESLAIVGAISAAGAVPFMRAGYIDWRSVWFFGVPGMVGTYLGAALAAFVSGSVQLLLFAAVMVVAAVLMYRGARGGLQPAVLEANADRAAGTLGVPPRRPIWKIAGEGVLVGVLTGLVGVGGGFLIVPALVLFGGLPMRLAVGTSLIVIALKSFSGFWKYLYVLQSMHISIAWATVGVFIAVGVAGIWLGGLLNRRVDPKLLQQGFALFLVVMGGYVVYRELPQVWAPPAAVEVRQAEVGSGFKVSRSGQRLAVGSVAEGGRGG